MTVKEKVSQFVNAKLQNFKNVINKGLNTSPEAIKYAPTQFTGLVPELAAKAKLPKPIQKWAETPSNLTSKVPWYSPNLKPYSMIADLGVNLAKGMVFGDINTNKVSMPAYRKLSSGTPFNKLSGEEQLALNTAQENAKLNFGGMVAGPKATNFKALPKITGAFDNLPRAEISDLSSRVKGNFIDIITNLTKKGETPVLADVMGHDSLYKSYPQLKLMKIELDPTYVAQDMRGSFNPQTNSIKVNPTLSKGTFRSTLLHEVQHAVQEIEGFAKGASPDSMRPQELADQMVKAQLDFFKNPTPENRQTWKSLESALNSKKHPNALYRQVAGELEARSTQLREGMGTTQRKAINPYDQILQKEGINRADVIVNKGGGESLLSDGVKYGEYDKLTKSLERTQFKNLDQSEKEALLEEAQKMVAGGIGDVGVIKNEGDVVGRYSANPSWYKDFFKSNGRAPTNEEFFGLAYQRIKPVPIVPDGMDLDQAVEFQNIKPMGVEKAQKKLKDLMTYTDRLVKEKGLTPQQAQKIGFKKGMDILEGRATADIQPKALPKVGGVLKTTSPELQKPLQQATKPNALSPQTAQINPAERKVLQGGKVVQPLEEIIQRTPTLLKNKVGIIDYLRTPDKVLKKIGLANEAEQLKTSYNSYLDELPKEIGKITDWYNQAKSPESATKIFKRLDGQYADLNPTETKIANEIKAYLDKWADRLELPKDKRITNYITHIFDDQLIKKEFDEDLAKLIQDNVAGSVYDPFTQQRLGKLGYKENVWDALDAYVKRAVRKVNMDPALEQVKKASDHLETSQFNYVKSYIDRINMRPTEIDNLLDNSIKQLVGYRFGARPTANITRIGRQMVYRGTLGLNVGSSLRNLTQGVNTYSELGEKYTLIGYTNLMRKGTKELELNGILRNNMIEDRALNATKKFWEKADKALFYLFESVEKINRGAAYFGAKAKALKNGATEQQAIEYGRTIVRKTQFTFGKVDTPVALQSDIVKLFSQFQSYNLKQMEFVGGMIKAKDVAGLARYTIGSLVVLETVGKLLGMDWKDLIPSIRIGVPPTITAPIEIGKAATGGKDKYGNELTPEERLKNAGGALIPFAPGGVQIKKTVGGIGDVSRGYAQTGSGNVKYPVAQTPTNAVRGALFGGYNLPEAEANRKDDIAPLSPKQSKSFIDSGKKQSTYDVIIQRRMQTALETKIKAIAKQVTAGELTQSEGREQMREVVDEKTIYESSSDAPKNIVSKVALYGQSLIADPSFTFEAVVEGNPLRKMSGDATVLERQKYLGTLDAGNTKTEVDHVIPLSLGGTNEDSNLQILRSEENALKASYELELLSQLKSGEINKKQAQNLILDWKSHVDLTLLPAIAEELAKATKTTKTKAKVKTTKKLKAAKLPKLKKYKSKKIKLAKVKVSSLKNFTYLPKLKAPSGVSQKTLDELRHPRV